ncbi:MAG: hypothetical protein AAGF47_06240 [Planctomycetota bacterium]
MTHTPAPRSSPACPRCGYDLSGQLDSYRDACPLEAVCSECGCGFAWCDVHLAAEAPRWFVERRASGWWRRPVGTTIRTLNPFAFLRSIRMEHTVRIPRLLGWLLVLGVIVGVLRAATRFAQLAILQPTGKLFGTNALLDLALHVVWPPAQWGFVQFQRYSADLFHVDFDYHADFVVHPSMTIALSVAASTWFLFLMPWQSLESKKILRRHIVRLSLYSLPGLLCIAIISMGLEPDRQLERWANASIWSRRTPAWDLFWDWRILVQDLQTKRWLCFLGVAAWQTLWWWLAAKRYLRLDRPAAFVLPLLCVSLFSTVVLTYVLAAADREWVRYVLIDPTS